MFCGYSVNLKHSMFKNCATEINPSAQGIALKEASIKV